MRFSGENKNLLKILILGIEFFNSLCYYYRNEEIRLWTNERIYRA